MEPFHAALRFLMELGRTEFIVQIHFPLADTAIDDEGILGLIQPNQHRFLVGRTPCVPDDPADT